MQDNEHQPTRSAHAHPDRPTPSSPYLRLIPCLLTGLALASPPASTQGNDYDCSDYFDISNCGFHIDSITWSYKVKAKARTRKCKDKGKLRDSVQLSILGPDSDSAGVVFSPDPGERESYAAAHSEISYTIDPADNTRVHGSVRAHGTSFADLGDEDSCHSTFSWFSRKSARAKAKSWSKVVVKWFEPGLQQLVCGVITTGGSWINKSRRVGDGTRSVIRDPVVVRHTDEETGVVSTWELSHVRSVVGRGTGFTQWDRYFQDTAVQMLVNTAENMTFEFVIESPVIDNTEWGTLRIAVKDSVVTESVQTGVFATLTGVPAVGHPYLFMFPLPDYQYTFNLPVQPNPLILGHGVEVIIDCGAHNLGIPDDNPYSECTLLTDLGIGFEDSDISTPETGDIDLGFNAHVDRSHVAVPLEVPAGRDVRLDAMIVPLFQRNAPPGVATINAAYVQLWSGDPMSGGTLIGGDMTTNVLALEDHPPEVPPFLYDVDEDVDVYRVHATSPTNAQRRVQEAFVRLDGLPLLTNGTYYLEMAFESTGPEEPEVIPCNDVEQPGRVYDVVGNAWQVAQDSLSNRPVHFIVTVFAEEQIGDMDPNCDPLSNSTGLPAMIALTGTGTAGDLLLGTCFQGPPANFGYFISGPNPGLYIVPPGSSGIICIGPPAFRYNSAALGQVFQFDPFGVSQAQVGGGRSLLPTDGSYAPVPAAMAGESRAFQAWFRDFNPAQTSNFSESKIVMFQ
ncbi:MAG: hypothetical protein GY711_12970 [bacterium]|nr:hypothetical protein [bacterium]